MFEFRYDYCKIVNNLTFNNFDTNAIFTLRDKNEGGFWDNPFEEKFNILGEADKSEKFEYLDIEYNWCKLHNIDLTSFPYTKIILSTHILHRNWKQKNILELVQQMKLLNPALIKIVLFLRNYDDLLFLQEICKRNLNRIIAIGTGVLGKVSRILYRKIQSLTSFAGIPNHKTSESQLTPEEIEIFNPTEIDDTTKLFGLVGSQQIFGSLGYEHYNRIFQEKKFNARYVPLYSDNVDDLLSFVSEFSFQGFSITMPFKEAIPNKMGAKGTFNLCVWKENKFQFINTDIDAIEKSFELLTISKEDTICILGAGGVAKIICEFLSEKSFDFVIVNRTKSKGEKLANQFNKNFYNVCELKKLNFSVLINATPLGSNVKEIEVFPEEIFSKNIKILDLAYCKNETSLISLAKRKKLEFIDGKTFWKLQSQRQLREFLKFNNTPNCKEYQSL